MAEAIVSLHLVTGSDGQVASFGEPQAEWLVERRHAISQGIQDAGEGTAIARYLAPNHTARELDALVVAQPELRECDFCGEGAGWRVNLRARVTLRLPGMEGPIERPIFACETCAALVAENRRADLVDRMLETRTAQAVERGAFGEGDVVVAPAGRRRIRERLAPALTDFVSAVFAARRGFPERDR